MRRFFLFVICFLPPALAAHDSATVELVLDVKSKQFSAELDLLDTDFIVDLARADPGVVTVADVYRSSPEILAYVRQHLHIDNCALEPLAATPGIRPGVRPRIIASFRLECADKLTNLVLQSSLFEELPGYRTALSVVSSNESRLYVLDDGQIRTWVDGRGVFAGFRTFVVDGVLHILGGFDHLVFLLLLALPMLRDGSLRSSIIAIAGVVTAFTVAHSITLVLSSLGIMSLPPRPVEIMIAASVVLVAVINVLGKGGKLAWPLAYVFGLVHGFGFAGAFAELAAGASIRWPNLLAFNLGVELGQLAVVALVLITLRALARPEYLGRRLVPAGSILAACVGVSWIIARI